MKFLALLVAVTLISLVKTQEEFSDEWEQWKIKHPKSYSVGRSVEADDQEKVRFSVFQDNMQKIKSFNSKNNSFKMGTNEYSDMTEEELKSRFTINIDQNKVKKNIKNANKTVIKSGRAPVNTVNWVTSGYVAPVQNQGSCGSCYTFSTIAALESAYAIKYSLKNAVKSFSAQQLLDCSYYKYSVNGAVGNLGCNGGYDYHTLYYVYQYGIQQASSYPYVGYLQSCRYSSSQIVGKTKGIYTASYSMGDITAMKAVVSRQPLMVYIYVTTDFYSYKSGIYTGPNCSNSKTSCPLGINHAVTIVGYGTDNGVAYWIVKNSWGTSWGEAGYFRIAMGQNTCCIEGYSFYSMF